jgi:deoxycytidine triphosphate deaminase
MSEEKSETKSKQPDPVNAESGNAPPPPAIESPVGKPAPMHPNSDKWLWVDPAKDDEFLKHTIRFGAVLLAEDITSYVERYNVLIDKNDFSQGFKFGAKLKGASYTMSPDPKEGWMFEKNTEGEVHQIPLEKGLDSDGEYYIVPKNALVYIKLRQKLRIPYYFIGRHNLKIRYVYKGLLLGTGPQVDPGFVGNLFIPLHNFTTNDVFIHINDSFVSIDFVRTTALFADNESEIPDNRDELYARFKKSKHLLDQGKLEDRKTLNAYLEHAKPQSQMGQFYSDFKQLKSDLDRQSVKLGEKAESIKVQQEKFQSRWNRYKAFEIIAAIAVIMTSLTLFRLMERDFQTTSLDYNRLLITTNLLSVTQELTQMSAQNDEFKKTINLSLDESNEQNALLQVSLRNTLSNLDENMQILKKSVQQLMNSSSQSEKSNKVSNP